MILRGKGVSGRIAEAIPEPVLKRALSAGDMGREWLAGLDGEVAALETQWHIHVGDTLLGGTHAYVACAFGRDGRDYVLKVDMPESFGDDGWINNITALRIARGQGYARLYAYDSGKRACLLERLGRPLSSLGYPVREQLRIICGALEKSWRIPVEEPGLSDGTASIAWFRTFLEEAYETLGRPCPESVLRQAFRYLDARERELRHGDWVLVHGDAHSNNTLEDLSPDGGFKLVDPDGIFYEKAYDLGVLMREWSMEYAQDSLERGRRRCRYLHELTGAPEQAIWEWGFLQTVSTSFVLLQIGQKEEGRRMLRTAWEWLDAGEKE